jgi:hypothetical protein
MNLSDFKATIASHPDKNMSFVLPDGRSVPANYHITEVGRVRKDFIDCGGTVRSSSSCVLQAWVAANDGDHRLQAGKLGAILQLAGPLLADSDLPVELEYEAPLISQFTVTRSEVKAGNIVFHLKNKRTDCLAKESCGLEDRPDSPSEETSCCRN